MKDIFICQLYKKLKHFVLNDAYQLWLDDSGKYSMAKVSITAIIFMIILLVITYLTFAVIEFAHTLKIPTWPVAIAGAITALVGCISALYAVNKFSPTLPFTKTDKKEDAGGDI